jgi:hypothetical protein
VNESGAPDAPPAGIDTSRPNIARVYDYLLGGKDNFTADRELAGQLLSVNRAGTSGRAATGHS